MKKVIDGNMACANTAYLFSEMAMIYPITPSSPMASEVDLLSHTGKKNLFSDQVSVVEMQSEAGAAGAMHGALLSGSLATTFTASQGLLLMIPNMYKMAGEMLPGVIHVASRSLATHALSIFGDHQDVYATRATGFCMLASSSVEDASYLAAVAHLSAIKGSLPFLHFFDGFRTSHELNTIDVLSDESFLSLIDMDAVQNFKSRMLNVGRNTARGLAENEDIYFQSMEARNKAYEKMPDIVNEYMNKIGELTHKEYAPFVYHGSKDATNIIIAMGSVCDTIRLVVDDLCKQGKKVGMVEVHLYRPFSPAYLKKVIPATVENIAVLDRTKEAGSNGEPLYLDVLSVLGNSYKIVGGRYGLSSKNTTPSDIYSVYHMLEEELKNPFTIGIVDDITHYSLEKEDYHLSLSSLELQIYGFGSDGMVSASKEILKLIGSTNRYVQGYFEYDSKKSGGVTVSHLRIGNEPIKAPFYVTEPSLLVVTKQEYFERYDLLSNVRENGYLLLSTIYNEEELNENLPVEVRKKIVDKKLHVYTINAEKIAALCGIKGKISKILEVIILKLVGYKTAKEDVTFKVRETLKTKGENVILANEKAIELALEEVKKIHITNVSGEEVHTEKDLFTCISRREGNNLTVGELYAHKDGSFPLGTSMLEKRRVSNEVPKWISSNCIQCGLCALVCPHAVIRPMVSDTLPHGIPFLGKDGLQYEIMISEEECTGCGLCITNCPGKGGEKALQFVTPTYENHAYVEKMFLEHENPEVAPLYTVKGSQLRKPYFAFSGACAGCGETPYLKLLTQLFQDRLIIANATGCSSIYGGSVPSIPYSIPWANSLFEDNAEFGYGMYLSYQKQRNLLENLMKKYYDDVSIEVKELFDLWINHKEDYAITRKVKKALTETEIPLEIKNHMDDIPSRSIWCVGGDGWAYDIGFGGLDHVLSSNENLKVLVLDTEVYSNTGGQASKSSHRGQVAEFANMGKKTSKKDLFRIAMSYPNCYVASVSLGANPMQTIRAMKEAEEHDGPALIIAYSPCIEHGIKEGMSNSVAEEKLAVEVGYVSLKRYDPIKEELYLDSAKPNFDRYEELLDREVRYHALKIKDPDIAKELLEQNKEDAMKNYLYYEKLSTK